MSAYRSILCVTTAVLAVSLTACNFGGFGPGKKPGEAVTAGKPPEIVIPVEASLPETGSISDYFTTTARVEAESKVEVTSEGAGAVLQILVEEGDLVAKGDVLAELDKEEALAARSQAVTQKNENENAYLRAKEMHEQGLSSKAEFDSAYFTYQQSIENVTMQELKVANLTISAPFDGVVTKRHIQRGQLVNMGNPAFSVVDPSSYMLAIGVPERFLPRLREGQVAQVTIDAIPGLTFETRVRRINPAMNTETAGTVKVLLDFEQEAKLKMMDSAFARVQLVMDTHVDAILAPKESVLEENGRKYVYVVRRAPEEAEETDSGVEPAPAAPVEESTKPGEVLASPKEANEPKGPEFVAERLEIGVDLEDADSVEIVSGIEKSDLIVTNGQHTLKPGQKVKVTNVTDDILAKANLDADEALAAAEKRREGANGAGTGEGADAKAKQDD